MTYAILWIEDNLQSIFAPYLAPILADSSLYLQQVPDAAQAFEALKHHAYDLIVFDLDLPPGENKEMEKIYRHCTPQPQKATEALGYYLLQAWLERPRDRSSEDTDLPADIEVEKIRLPPPLSTSQVVVYSVFANNFRKELLQLGLQNDHIIQKSVKQSRFYLHRQIKVFLKNRSTEKGALTTETRRKA